MPLRIAIVMSVAGLLALAAPATASKPNTFEGTCTMAGTVTQDPPMTNVPAPGQATARLSGTCSGTLTDRRGRTHTLDAAPSRYVARASGTVGCGGGTTAGAGALRIAGRRIRFSFSEVRGPGVATVRLEGRRGGSATGTANVSSSEDPAEIAAACGGAGLREVDIEAQLATTPSLSG